MKHVNEQPSPPVRSNRVVLLQVLGLLKRYNRDTFKWILDEAPLTEDKVLEAMDALLNECVEAGELQECGSCGSYHRPDFNGDCRNDNERFPLW